LIDPRAVIDPGAKLDEDVKVGPFAVIGPGVRIKSGTEIGSHAVIKGPSLIGHDNHIFQFASIGEVPQDKKYHGEETYLEIGDRNQIREFTTINRGTAQDAVTTRIGNDNLLMAYTHVAHDCQIGNHAIMANASSLGGHVTIDDWAILGGFAIVHQFCQIGSHSFSAMGSVINKAIPPYVTVAGHPAKPHGINSEGLMRRGFSTEAIAAIRRAYKKLYMNGLRLDEAVSEIEGIAKDHQEVALMVEFLRASERSVIR